MNDIDNDERALFAVAYALCGFSGAIMGFIIGMISGWAIWA